MDCAKDLKQIFIFLDKTLEKLKKKNAFKIIRNSFLFRECSIYALHLLCENF